MAAISFSIGWKKTTTSMITASISAAALRTVEHRGGLDAFLLKQADADLSPLALGIKKEIRATLAA